MHRDVHGMLDLLSEQMWVLRRTACPQWRTSQARAILVVRRSVSDRSAGPDDERMEATALFLVLQLGQSNLAVLMN